MNPPTFVPVHRGGQREPRSTTQVPADHTDLDRADSICYRHKTGNFWGKTNKRSCSWDSKIYVERMIGNMNIDNLLSVAITQISHLDFLLSYCHYTRWGKISTYPTHSHGNIKTSSSIGTTAQCGLWPVEQYPSIFSYLPPTLSIFSLPALEDLFPLPLFTLSWVFPFFSSLPVLQWRSFWASYPPPFSLGDLISLSFALLSILLYFLLHSSPLVLDSSDFSIPRFHI